jgi:hypothetical protein
VISGIGELEGWVSNASQDEEQAVYVQVKNDSEQEDETGDGQIDPLYVLQCTLVVANMIEDGIRSNDGRYNGTDTKNEVSDSWKKNDGTFRPGLTH